MRIGAKEGSAMLHISLSLLFEAESHAMCFWHQPNGEIGVVADAENLGVTFPPSTSEGTATHSVAEHCLNERNLDTIRVISKSEEVLFELFENLAHDFLGNLPTDEGF